MIGLLFAFSIVVLSMSPILIRFADASSPAIVFWRMLFATGLLLPVVVHRGQLRALTAVSRSDALQLLLSGGFLFAHFYFFFRAVQETSIANSTILFSLNPVTTAIGAYLLFRERVNLHLVLSCLLGFAGIAVLFSGSLQSEISTLHGDVWGLLSAVTFSGYILTGKRVRQKLSNVAFASCIYLQTTIYGGLLMMAEGLPFLGYSTTTWWIFLALAIFPTLLGHAIFTYCLNFLNVNFMSCATLVEPVLAAAVAWALFGEPLTDLAALGFLLTVASVLVLYTPWLTSSLRRKG